MNWRNLITGIYESLDRQPEIAQKPEFHPAASSVHVDDAESLLTARFPKSLRSLLSETDGVMDMMSIKGGDWFASMWLLWPVEEIVEQNDFRRRSGNDGIQGRDFRRLLFFAGAGSDGILFGFPVSEDGFCSPRVVAWTPISDELSELTTSLEGFLHGWLMGTTTV